MTAKPVTRLSIFVCVLVALLGVWFVFADTAKANENKPPYLPFKVINESQFEFTIYLLGPESYAFSVPPHSEDWWIVERGEYSFTMDWCNYTEKGSLDMTMRKTMHVPVCGGSALVNFGYKPYNVDAGDYIKPVKVEIQNRTKEEVDVYIRTSGIDHFLNFEPLEKKTIIVLKGEYAISYVACGKLYSGYYTPYIGRPYQINCPE